MPLPREESTIAFLKLAAIELRKIADDAPDIADRIRQIVEEPEAETAELEQRCELRVPDLDLQTTTPWAVRDLRRYLLDVGWPPRRCSGA